MPRLLIVSNRLPVTVRNDHGNIAVTRSPGGLATALSGPHDRLDSLWLGWPGDVSRLAPPERRTIEAELTKLRAVPIHLSTAEVHRYYDGFSNGVLWPLFHYLLDKVNLDAQSDWEAYREVNERFASAVAERYRPGDTIWIHDYQLMLLPALLRRRLPDAKIGFFLHIPFPAAEVFRILPWREQLLRGLLGADRIGFHTSSYRHHFVYSAARVLGTEPDEEVVEHDGRKIALGVYPIGVDVREFERLAADPGVQAEATRLRAEAQGRRIVLGIDRLDYTKGIPRRLLAVERLLECEPELRSRVRFVQLAVPTREKVGTYAEFRRHVNEMVGHINGQYGSVDAVPIHYLHRSLNPEQIVALYLAADVMLVTPLRDGMNLVAKEYIASRRDEQGALVLSEFAGAADELAEALQVNPYDIDSVAIAVKQALSMPPSEQRLRMQALRRRVAEQDVHLWAQSFLDDLGRTRAGESATSVEARPRLGEPSEEAFRPVRQAPGLVLALDYDGTLVSITRLPELAAPDEELLALLRALGERPCVRVHVVSGRSRGDLERWLSALPIGLHAEHGFWSRAAGVEGWTSLGPFSGAWKDRLRPILQEVTRQTAGSLIEEKMAALAWHYRAVAPELAHERVRELQARLAGPLREHDIELLAGSKVLEVRPKGVHKGRVVPALLDGAPVGAAVVAIGDDRTDEELFAALPPHAVTIHVGEGTSRAAYRLPDPAAVRRLLRSFLTS